MKDARRTTGRGAARHQIKAAAPHKRLTVKSRGTYCNAKPPADGAAAAMAGISRGIAADGTRTVTPNGFHIRIR
jgi:hypothetical protein